MTSPRPGLVATDLDGTLLRSDGSVSAHTRAVLAAVQQVGVPVVLVTARPLRWMGDLWPLVAATGWGVVGNGAVVYDVAAGEVVGLHPIAPDAGAAVTRALVAALPAVQLAVECVDGTRLGPGYPRTDEVPPESPRVGHDGLWDVPVTKLLVREPGTDPERLREVVAGAVGTTVVPTWTVPGLVEISAAGVTKASGLAELCDRLDVAPADVVAFGDMPNDLPMLALAGTGCAVANAHASVLAAADRVVGSNDDDGVARELVRLLPEVADLV